MRDNAADYDQIEMRVKKAIETSGITYDNEDTFKKLIIELIDIASDVGSCKAMNKLNDDLKNAFDRSGMRRLN